MLSLKERVQRRLAFSGADPQAHLASFAIRRFHPHIFGLQSLAGREVLEIGGGKEINLKGFFTGIGASYLNVRLEPNRERDPCVITGDFMEMDGSFDLVISLGVFEIGAIDVDFERMEAGIIKSTPAERSAKLASLTAEGGFCVIGTINAPCMLPSRELESAGFSILLRESPFYSFMNAEEGMYGYDDRSELLILRKMQKSKK